MTGMRLLAPVAPAAAFAQSPQQDPVVAGFCSQSIWHRNIPSCRVILLDWLNTDLGDRAQSREKVLYGPVEAAYSTAAAIPGFARSVPAGASR